MLKNGKHPDWRYYTYNLSLSHNTLDFVFLETQLFLQCSPVPYNDDTVFKKSMLLCREVGTLPNLRQGLYLPSRRIPLWLKAIRPAHRTSPGPLHLLERRIPPQRLGSHDPQALAPHSPITKQRFLGSHDPQALARHSPITKQRTVLGSHSLLERRTPPQRLLGSHDPQALAHHPPITKQRTVLGSHSLLERRTLPQRLLGSHDPQALARHSPITKQRTVLGSHSLLERRTPPRRLLGSHSLAHHSPITEQRTVLGSHRLLERRTPPQRLLGGYEITDSCRDGEAEYFYKSCKVDGTYLPDFLRLLLLRLRAVADASDDTVT